tara:strand:+ start:182 stop:484 length:303 start_codon:yes stop_codon:yes gene_type:complete
MTTKFKQNLGKREISNIIKSEIGFSSERIQKVTDDIIESFISTLAEEKKVNIKNFGSFNIVRKKQRVGRNPKTKETFLITSRNSINFKASNQLKQKINEI